MFFITSFSRVLHNRKNPTLERKYVWEVFSMSIIKVIAFEGVGL